MYLFDSDVIIDYLKDKGEGSAIVKSLVGQEIAISVITWAEVLRGIKSSINQKERTKYLNEFITLSGCQIIPIDKPIAECFVDIQIVLEKQGQAVGDFDLLIASTALINNLTVVTGNTKHFQRIKDLKLFHPTN